MQNYPSTRPRRNRRYQWLRNLNAQHHLSVNDLIWPIFVQEGENISTPIESMKGVNRMSIDVAAKRAKDAADLGINAIAIFPAVEQNLKTDDANEALNPDNLMCRAISAIKDHVPEIGIIADVALDPYTSHGQDGLLENGYVANDATVDILAQQAIIQARAGADIIAPSDMMDGRVGRIRQELDAAGFIDIAIMSYAAKYASAFYGPFRDAVGSSKNLSGDKKTYQMDFHNSREAVLEIQQDVAQGADMLIIKPGMPYLDILKTTCDNVDIPVFAYQVSAEYAMIKLAAENGICDYNDAIYEAMISFKRAGARGIITYAALDLARYINSTSK